MHWRAVVARPRVAVHPTALAVVVMEAAKALVPTTPEAWNTKASTHVMDCFDHGMYGDALQLVAMTTMGGEDGAIAKYLRDEIHSVARRAAAAVTNAYSVEVTI